MDPTPRRVPMPKMDDVAAKENLRLLLERVVHLLHVISDHADFFIDGQHHQALRSAVGELTNKLGTGGWSDVLSQVAPVDLEQKGFTGSQGLLKFGAFDQQFRDVLDRIALLEARNKDLMVRLEGEDFHRKLRETPGIMRRLLDLSETALGSVKAMPGVGEVVELTQEMVGTTAALVRP